MEGEYFVRDILEWRIQSDLSNRDGFSQAELDESARSGVPLPVYESCPMHIRYKVAWEGYDSSDDSWEPAECLPADDISRLVRMRLSENPDWMPAKKMLQWEESQKAARDAALRRAGKAREREAKKAALLPKAKAKATAPRKPKSTVRATTPTQPKRSHRRKIPTPRTSVAGSIASDSAPPSPTATILDGDSTMGDDDGRVDGDGTVGTWKGKERLRSVSVSSETGNSITQRRSPTFDETLMQLDDHSATRPTPTPPSSEHRSASPFQHIQRVTPSLAISKVVPPLAEPKIIPPSPLPTPQVVDPLPVPYLGPPVIVRTLHPPVLAPLPSSPNSIPNLPPRTIVPPTAFELSKWSEMTRLEKSATKGMWNKLDEDTVAQEEAIIGLCCEPDALAPSLISPFTALPPRTLPTGNPKSWISMSGLERAEEVRIWTAIDIETETRESMALEWLSRRAPQMDPTSVDDPPAPTSSLSSLLSRSMPMPSRKLWSEMNEMEQMAENQTWAGIDAESGLQEQMGLKAHRPEPISHARSRPNPYARP